LWNLTMRYLTVSVLVLFGILLPRAQARADTTAPEPHEIEGAIVPGNHTRIETSQGPVHVWAPEGYRAQTASLVIYIHGYHVVVDDAWWAHGLPEQFGAAAINALFVVPTSPSGPGDAVRWPSIQELLVALDGKLAEASPKGPVTVIGHSGAYRTIEQWLADPMLSTVVLLDAGYGARPAYLSWLRKAPAHRLITVSSDTVWWGNMLHAHLPATRTIAGIPKQPETLQRDRAIHVRTNLDHWQVVTKALPATLRMLRAPQLGDEQPSEEIAARAHTGSRCAP
jgi:hypothetical protein